MKSLVLSRGARLACAFTLTTLALACWAATPSFASNFADRFGADKKLNLTSPGTPHAAAGSLSGTIVPERLPAAACGVPGLVRFSFLSAPNRSAKFEAKLGVAAQQANAKVVSVKAHARRAPRESTSDFIEGVTHGKRVTPLIGRSRELL